MFGRVFAVKVQTGNLSTMKEHQDDHADAVPVPI
jgi:hypothetical protein